MDNQEKIKILERQKEDLLRVVLMFLKEQGALVEGGDSRGQGMARRAIFRIISEEWKNG